MTKTKTFIFSLRSLTLLIFVSIFAQLIIPVSTQAAPPVRPVEESAYSWQAYYYFLGCSDNNTARTSLTSKQATTYAWYDNKWVDAGFVLGGDDAKAACNMDDEQWLSKALSYWGFAGDAGGFLKATGYQENSDGSFKFVGKLNGGAGANCGNREECFRSVINSKYYGLPANANFIGTPSAQDAYLLASKNFTVGCSATQQKLWKDATPDEKRLATGNDNKNYQIKIVNAQGAVEEWLFTADKVRGDDIIVGPGLPNLSNLDDVEMTCLALADTISSNAAGAAAYNKTAVAANLPSQFTSDPAANSADDPNVSCEEEIEFGWAICPIARTADTFAGWVQGVIVSLLRINSTPEAYAGIKQGWSQMRIISSALIVLVALVMVASQIFNFEFMTAYTMKKVLPKLVIAAILIQLSWFIFTTMISIVNALGDGVAAILLSPFPDLAAAAFSDPPTTLQFILTTFGENAASRWTFGGGAMLLAGGALVGFGAIGGLAGLGLAAIGVILACLVAFVTLVLRKVLILALLLIAPLALVAWILPGTQKWWEKWWDMFSKLLFMYPLVIGLITVGQIGAYLAAQTGSFVGPGALPGLFADVATESSTMVVFFIILICFFGPFFFIPSMFKLGGTVLAKAATFAKTGSDSFKKARPYRNLEKARENNKTGRDINAKEKGINRAAGNTTFGRLPGFGRAVRGYGRLQAGTAGATGGYARQLRGNEREAALKNATVQISEDIKELGLTDYDDQLDYQVALAKGQKEYLIKKGANAGNTIKVRGYGSQGQQVAARSIIESGKADRIRDVKTTLISKGVVGEKIWSDTMETHAGKAVAVAADAAGKPLTSLRASEAATQDPGTLRNMAAMMEAAQRSGDADTVRRLRAIAAEVADTDTLMSSVNQEGQEYINFMAGRSTTRPSGLAQDYKGQTGVPGIPPTMDEAVHNAQEQAAGRGTGGF